MSKQIRVGAHASIRADHRHPACVFAISAGLSAIFSLSLCLTGSAQREAQQPVTTTAASRNAALVAAQTGALARPSGRAQQDPVAIKTARNAALVAATADVLKETSEIRQLPILRPVQSSTQSRAEIERMLIKNLDEETTPAQIHATEVTLKKLGLAPADFQYRALMLRLLTEQVAGYYDPKTQQFHLADWIDLDGQKPVMAHELTHALQDQHFNLRRFEHWPKGDSDAELAAHALIEGDATLAMTLYVTRNPLRALAFLKSLGASGMPSDELDHAPRALRETLLFPYQEGILWTRNLYQRGGWNEVSQAFTTLPQSTEQVMHSEKYFAHEAPVKVALPDITALLNGSGQRSEVRGQRSGISGQWAVAGEQLAAGSAGILPVFGGTDFRSEVRGTGVPPVSGYSFAGSADVPSALSAQREQSWILPTAHRSLLTGGWRRLDTDVNGEWGFYLILDQFLKSPAESRRAAAGWGGDRYSIYEGPKGEVLYISLSTWDTENDAREFFEAYVKRTERRYASAIPLEPTPNAESPASSKAFRTSQGTVLIERRGPGILVVEGIPDQINSNSLAKSLWQE